MAAVSHTEIDHFQSLPQEILSQVLGLLPRADAVQAARTCRDFKTVVNRQANQCKTICIDHPSFDARKFRQMLETSLIKKLTFQADNTDPKPLLTALFQAMATDGVTVPELTEVTMNVLHSITNADRATISSVFPNLTLKNVMQHHPVLLALNIELRSNAALGVEWRRHISLLGNTSEIFFSFKRTASLSWLLQIKARDPSTVTTSGDLLTEGTLEFDADGKLIEMSDTLNHFEILWDKVKTGHDPMSILLDFGRYVAMAQDLTRRVRQEEPGSIQTGPEYNVLRINYSELILT